VINLTWYTPTEAQRRMYKEWVEQPENICVQDLARRYPPWNMYKMRELYVFVTGFTTEGMLRVAVTARYNFVMEERVQEATPEELVLSGPPPDGHIVGFMLGKPSERSEYEQGLFERYKAATDAELDPVDRPELFLEVCQAVGDRRKRSMN
jgi:hypothetical protein